MVRDMTSGSPMKLIVGFAVPIFLGNLFQQLYSVVDAMVLGRAAGADALAAAGSTQALSFLVLGFITGLTHGYAILIAQRFGAGDYAGVRRTAANAGYLAAVSSLIITAASLLGARALLEVMHTPEDIFRDALLYIQVIFIGTAASVAYNMFSGILRALGDSVSPLVILVVSSIVNVGLDVLFVVVFQWGVAGAAWATVLAQALSSAMCFAVLRRLELMRFQREDWRGDRDVIRALLRLGVPVGIMNSITAMGTMLLQSVVNGLGSVTVAAYTAGSKLMNLALQPGDILGIAVGTYVGQNLGAGKSEEAVIEAAYPYFVITGAGVWIVGLLFLYRFALQSLGDTFIPMVSGGVELGMRVGAVLVLDRCFDMGFYAVCWAEVAAWLGAGVLLAVGYYARMARLSRQEQ